MKDHMRRLRNAAEGIRPQHSIPPRNTRGFSLVEVTLALGVVSFALLALVGVMPAGLSTMRQAADKLVESQVVRQLGTEALHTPFSELSSRFSGVSTYYDDAGLVLSNASASGVRYRAEVVLAQPAFPGSTSEANLTNSLWTMRISLATVSSGREISTNYYNIQVPNSGD